MKFHRITLILSALLVVLLSALAILEIPSKSVHATPLYQTYNPEVVSYQGQVSVDNKPFNGIGYFKFAVLTADKNAVRWSNDGAGNIDTGPNTAVAIQVSRGLFSVLLGDNSLSGMTQALQASVFTGGGQYLRIWFSPDGKTFIKLDPDQRIAMVPYAMTAQEANNADTLDGLHASEFTSAAKGSIILGEPDDPQLIDAGFEKIGQSNVICADCDRWNPLPTDNAPSGRTDHTVIWTGKEMLIWGGSNEQGWLNDGGRYDPKANTWQSISLTNAPTPRLGFISVWTGSEMIIWGGWGNPYGGNYLTDGARYDPVKDTWKPMSVELAPVTPNYANAVWTGTEMVVWGGYNSYSGSYTGGRYNPVTDQWLPMSTNGGLMNDPRVPTVWTGKDWVFIKYGLRYTPETDTWSSMNWVNVPNMRSETVAVWTGKDILLWNNPDQYESGRYDPEKNIWRPISTVKAPTYRSNFVYTWTGTDLIIWGGAYGNRLMDDGAMYNPVTDTWRPLPYDNTPTARIYSKAVWTGSEILLWGGKNSSSFIASGASLSPSRYLDLYRRP